MNYDSTRPLPKAPTRLTPAKARAALRSDIAAAERYMEICPEDEREKVMRKIECLRRVERGLISA